ncbi:MAG: MarR family transcriptional regulator [Candidatus Microbacterium colombiense]|nr:MAG: MarR family transcriptional regulator [Microbacterium sp.]
MTEGLSAARRNEAVCLALYSTMNATLQLYRDLLAPWGLSYQQLMVLGLLWSEGEQTPGQISEALLLDSSSVAGLLSRMQSADLIERETSESDRRRVRVLPTARSRAIIEELGWLEGCLTQAIALDPDEAHDLVTRLHDLRERVAAFPRPEQEPAGVSA